MSASMPVLRSALVAAFCLGLVVDSASAQLRSGASDRDRAGILGRVGARRDDRLGRTPPPNPTAPGQANTQPNTQANPQANRNQPPNGQTPNSSANPNGMTNGQTTAYGRGPAGSATLPRSNSATNNSRLQSGPAYANRNPGAPTPAPQPSADGAQAEANQRRAFYGSATGPNPRGVPNGALNNANALQLAEANPANSAPRPSMGDAPVNRLPYRGPGVLIRLSRDVQGEVNYLIDDQEHLVIHAGQVQLLRKKDSYEVRFSRGVTSDGKSYGEARYTINEGIYRFDVSANGWELYREGEASDVPTVLAELEKQADQERSAALAEAANQAESQKTQATPPLPSPAPTTSEETLPAPKSILEPS